MDDPISMQGHGGELEKTGLDLGFIPLTDCAPLVIAREKGFFGAQGLEVRLVKETSWANIRDKVAMGILDGAHMLAPMPLAATLGLGPLAKPMVTAFSLGLNGNAVTVSEGLATRLRERCGGQVPRGLAAAQALRDLIDADRADGRPGLVLAVVFPFSMHHYQLRYWLAAGGIDPDRDLRFVTVPPAQMVGRLRRGAIDGFCVGEPWNSVAVREGVGRVLATGYCIWRNGPEKVFGVTEEWAEQHPRTHLALLRALLEAARWLDAPENRPEAVAMIARGIYVNAPPEVVRMSLNGTFQLARDEFPRSLPDFNVFHRYAANFPWRSHALWILSQMVRWGQISEPLELRAIAERVYRPDLFREAAAPGGMAVPAADWKWEGARAGAWEIAATGGRLSMGSDLLIDGALFSPADPIGFVPVGDDAQPGSALDAWRAANPLWAITDQAAIAGEPPAAAAGEV